MYKYRAAMDEALLPLAAAVALTACSASRPPRAAEKAFDAAPAARMLTLTDSDKGRTVKLRVGDTLILRLSSTYWTIDASSAADVLGAVGRTAYQPASRQDIPGLGQGTATARFTALAKGTAVLRASRTSCGEAVRCSPEEGSFRVTVVVD